MYDPNESLFQLGLYDYVWGNPALLQTYNANVQAEKARQEQNAYNNLWKQLEMDKAEREWQYNKDKLQVEKDKLEAEKARTAEAKVAQLLKQRAEAKNAIEVKQLDTEINSLLSVYPQFKGQVNGMRAAQEEDKQYAKDLNVFKGQLKRNFNTDADIDNEVQRVIAEPWLRESDRSGIISDLQSKKSTAQMAAEARQGAVASHSGKKTTESLEERDLGIKASDAINSNKKPAELDDKVRNKIREMGRSWDGTKWRKR